MGSTTSRRKPLASLALAAAGAIIACAAHARIVSIDIVKTESPTFAGAAFGSAGTYDKIVGRAHGVLDPNDPHNAVITDITLAPRNAQGLVEYAMDVYMFRPTDPGKGSGKLFYEVVNRGSKLGWSVFNGLSSNDPTTAADAGSGFLMRQGYTIVWSGWEDPFVIGSNGLTASLPVARNPDGSSVTGQTIFEQIFDAPTGDTYQLLYKAATTDKSQAVMYVRNHSDQPNVAVPSSVWSFVDNQNVKINRADPFLAGYDNGAAYTLVYTAKDPLVLGVGFAATRDLVSFLRNDTTSANPARGAVRYTLAHGQSQSGRYLKGFIHWGFNADESNRRVFDGVNPFISGAHDIASNERWGDANATGRKYQRHTIAKQEFPFTYEVRTDPVSSQTDGIFLRCQGSNTCPLIVHTDSGNEPYLKPTFLVTSDGLGHDIALPSTVRVYDVGSTQHAPQSTITTTPASVCQQPGNPNQWAPYVRALFIALDQWTTAGVEPPPSAYARVSDGTAVPTPQAFPKIPGVRYTGWVNPVAVLDKSHLPYTPVPGKDYVTYVPKVDADGNDLPGVRTLNVLVPTATYTGWGLRRAGFAENEDCGLTGQYIPFAKTKAERDASGDPRPSLQERYGTLWGYYFALSAAATQLVAQRYLLAEDAVTLFQQSLNAMLKSDVLPKDIELAE